MISPLELVAGIIGFLGLLVAIGLLIGPERPSREPRPRDEQPAPASQRRRRRVRRTTRALSAAESTHVAELKSDEPL